VSVKETNVYYGKVGLVDLLDIIWRRKYLIIIPTLLIVMGAGVASFLLPPKWEVDSIILPSKFFVQTENGQFQEVVVINPRQVAGQINQESYNRLLAAQLNLDPRHFPKLKAETLRDTSLIRVSLHTGDIDEGKKILSSLFNILKNDFDRKADVEIKGLDTQIEAKKSLIREKELAIIDAKNEIEKKKLQLRDKDSEIQAKDNDIKKKNNDIHFKELEIQLKEIEKSRLQKEIESEENKLKISEERIDNIREEMKTVKGRIDELDGQLKKTLAERKQGAEAVGLLLYSNEVQQNLRYYNTLDEKLSDEKVVQENLRFSIRGKQEQLRQIDTQINQIKTQQDSIQAEINIIMTEITRLKIEKEKIGTEIQVIQNEIERIKNSIRAIESEIAFLQDRKARIDYAQLTKEPTASLYPIFPKKLNIMLLSGFLGSFASLMLAFFVEYMKKQRLAR